MGERDAVGVSESREGDYHSDDEEEHDEDTVRFISTWGRKNINYSQYSHRRNL